jgi:hypothetical protein
MEKLLVVKVLVWLCNQLSIVAQEAILIQKLVNLHFLLIFLRLFVLKLIVMLMMILVVLIDVGLQGMLSLSVLRRSNSCAENEAEDAAIELQRWYFLSLVKN